MKESFPTIVQKTENKTELRPWANKVRNFAKHSAVFLSAFLGASHSNAQQHARIETSDKSKINAYQDSLDAYRADLPRYLQTRISVEKDIKEYNDALPSGQEKVKYIEDVRGWQDFPEMKGRRSGVPLVHAGLLDVGPRGFSKVIPMHGKPVQPYVLKKETKKDVLKDIDPVPLMFLNIDHDINPAEQVLTKDYFEIPSDTMVTAPTVRIYSFDTTGTIGEPKTIIFENEDQRQDWIKENASHLQKRSEAGSDFFDTNSSSKLKSKK